MSVSTRKFQNLPTPKETPGPRAASSFPPLPAWGATLLPLPLWMPTRDVGRSGITHSGAFCVASSRQASSIVHSRSVHAGAESALPSILRPEAFPRGLTRRVLSHVCPLRGGHLLLPLAVVGMLLGCACAGTCLSTRLSFSRVGCGAGVTVNARGTAALSHGVPASSKAWPVLPTIAPWGGEVLSCLLSVLCQKFPSPCSEPAQRTPLSWGSPALASWSSPVGRGCTGRERRKILQGGALCTPGSRTRVSVAGKPRGRLSCKRHAHLLGLGPRPLPRPPCPSPTRPSVPPPLSALLTNPTLGRGVGGQQDSVERPQEGLSSTGCNKGPKAGA